MAYLEPLTIGLQEVVIDPRLAHVRIGLLEDGRVHVDAPAESLRSTAVLLEALFEMQARC
jgi:hypothetical protein